MPPVTTARLLERLLDQRNEQPERLEPIDRQIRLRFERVSALLVLDMCGFSRLTVEYGIIHYLALIRRMQRTVLPLVKQHSGKLLKTEADNVFATFADVPAALAAARAILAEIARNNAVLPKDWDVHVSIGIGYGPLLMVGSHDAFGSEMNLASKLGEDIAKGEEILLTEAAWQRLGRPKRGFVARTTKLSGMNLRHFAFTEGRPASGARKKVGAARSARKRS